MVKPNNDIPGDVRPRNISLNPQGKDKHAFSGFFENESADVVARLIVIYCSKSNEWVHFKLSDIRNTGKQQDPPKKDDDLICKGFEWLLENNLIKHSARASFHVMQEFIRQCINVLK